MVNRILVVVIGLSLAWAAWSNAKGNVAIRQKPDMALGSVGLGDYPAARLAETQMIRNPRRFSAQAVVALARDSLRAQPVNSTALRLLVTLRGSGNGNPVALLFLSNRISRRDVATQMSLAQYYVSQEDAVRVIYHYDSAMRVSSDVEPVLFPVLADALEGTNIQQALAPAIRRGPRWLPNFVYFVIGSGKNIANLANAIMASGGLPKQPTLYRNLETQILGALATSKDFEVLRTYYRSLSGSDVGIFKSADFSTTNTEARFLPLSWQTYATTTVSATMEGSEDPQQKQLNIQVSSGERGIAARKLLFLTPGKALVSISYEFLEPGSDASATLTLDCLNADLTPTIWQMELRAVPGARKAQSVASVPGECSAQNLSINVAGGGASQGMQMRIHGISLRLVGSNPENF